ncbi:hypothetical protein BDA96_09G151300 [Sorghum bicolor]|uniref:Uncharacterized protein n=2 Tax=Sorghum bicolor TaxID=4558 RepID=A0A921U4N4_SORBI|nr:hypothetical protein BDA96_09G151300 [Sorghum bicolor]OQU78037.1 hypothetical protein SORBI_3009G143750 [Sorghum bicolor]
MRLIHHQIQLLQAYSYSSYHPGGKQLNSSETPKSTINQTSDSIPKSTSSSIIQVYGISQRYTTNNPNSQPQPRTPDRSILIDRG